MKLIQSLVLVVAVAVAAQPQAASTGQASGASSQSSGTNGQKQKTASGHAGSTAKDSSKRDGNTSKPGIGLVVPAPGSKTTSSKNPPPKSSSSSSAAGAKGTAGATAPKPGNQVGSAKTPAVNSTNTKPAAKPGVVQKTPMLSPKPGHSPVAATKSASMPPDSKKTVPKTAVKKPEKPVKIVSQKTDAKKPSDKEGSTPVSAAGRRDPFLSVIRNMPVAGPSGPNCSVGKRCLFIPDLELKGIAKDPDGQMLAVVVSNAHRAYFLRENDQVFNGSVQRITSDSVIFREFATDHAGRETAHEVVKRIPKS